jgi:RNA polymerase sigma-70 factor (ECF subfamily)
MAHAVQISARRNNRTGRAMTEQQMQEREHYATLIEKVAESQDTQAFQGIYEHFGPLIKAFAVSSGLQYQGDHLPEELVQEVMMTLWRKAALFDRKKAAPSTWLFTIARNQRIDMLRKLSKYQNDIDADDVWDLESDTDLFSDVRGHRIQNHVKNQLNFLPIEQKQIIAKVFLEDKSHQEVADELNLPLGTVKSRVRLAMQKLKTNLGAVEL